MLLLAAGFARADQCGDLDPDKVAQARNYLSLSSEYVSYCEPCSDGPPVKIHIQNVSGADRQILVNGVSLDVAYTYVNVADHLWANLGLMTNCRLNCDKRGHCTVGVDGVSAVLYEKDGKVLPPEN
jgi:hypothetical protein